MGDHHVRGSWSATLMRRLSNDSKPLAPLQRPILAGRVGAHPGTGSPAGGIAAVTGGVSRPALADRVPRRPRDPASGRQRRAAGRGPGAVTTAGGSPGTPPTFLVVDASVVIKWHVTEIHSDAALLRLRDAARLRCTCAGPRLPGGRQYPLDEGPPRRPDRGGSGARSVTLWPLRRSRCTRRRRCWRPPSRSPCVPAGRSTTAFTWRSPCKPIVGS